MKQYVKMKINSFVEYLLLYLNDYIITLNAKIIWF